MSNADTDGGTLKTLPGIRGMRTVTSQDARLWSQVQNVLVGQMQSYAYEEVRLPLVELTELFARGVGEATDIVEKEMYTLEDRDGTSMALRPEGTAGCVRALQEQGLLYNQTQRVFYEGLMFRYERPQLGRYRQFHQVGAEAFGFASADLDAELLSMCWDCWRALGIETGVALQLNTIGSSQSRAAFRQAFVDYLMPHSADLDEDSRRRLSSNPLRILDSKDAQTQALLNDAPRMADYLDEESVEHFEQLCELLDALDIPFEHNARLVRGLDYYTKTVFEWVTPHLGSQGTICGGGRYDRLVETLGGKPTPAAGFGMGLDRVVLLCEALAQKGAMRSVEAAADVYCCAQSESLRGWQLAVMTRLRSALPDLRFRSHLGGGKMKAQFKKADASGARFALIAGEEEAKTDKVGLKYLRDAQRAQETLTIEQVIERLRET